MKFWGKVKRHNSRGQKLGFPTANTNLYKNIADGIYISKTKIGKKVLNSVTFIGAPKTFGEKKIHSETFILDFKKNIYGKWISVLLLKKIRENKKFKSVEELIKQMQKDEEVTRAYFK